MWHDADKNPCFWRTQVLGATDTPDLAFWLHLWVSKPELEALFALGGGICVTWSLTFTSGVTPADLLVARIAAEPFSFTYLQAGIDGARKRE